MLAVLRLIVERDQRADRESRYEDACAATTYGVVAFVSTTTLLLSVGWRGLRPLGGAHGQPLPVCVYVLRARTTSTLVETSSA